MAEPGAESHVTASAFDIVAIAASAGGISAISDLLSQLPAKFPAPIVVVQHLAPARASILAELLARRTALQVRQAAAGDRLQPGVVHVAPPDQHLLVHSGGILSLAHTKLVHYVRPSADILLESVATSYGDRAVAIVLTGSGYDASAGVQAIKSRGGVVIVQNPATAASAGMPRAAVATGTVDYLLHLHEIGPALLSLMRSRGSK